MTGRTDSVTERVVDDASRRRDPVGYSLYLRSFADGNGDGVGDLRGAIEHLDHLADLGIDLVWVSPFYRSPMLDGGYDITDHCAVDPRYGSLADVDELIAEAHDRELAIVIDLVANHTSCDHPWFRAARSGRDDPFRDRYLWADPGPDGGPPNNWVSYFGGPAWTFDQITGQYYLHLFLPEQPDLDWRNTDVHDDYDRVLRFWLDRGVDGFRIDVAQGLVKDAAMRSNPQHAPLDPEFDRIEQWAAFDHRHDIAQPESVEIFRRWKRICDEYGATLIGEISVGDAATFASILADGGLDIGMWLETMHVEWGAASLRSVLCSPLERTAGAGRIGWQGSSLDEPRAATRFGGGEVGRRRALALTTLLMFLPGVPFLYQGEELGLEQGRIDEADRIDPVGVDAAASRDGCRTPMPWDTGAMHGFTDGDTTWLPFAGDATNRSVEAQRRDPGSALSLHRSLVTARRSAGVEPDAPVEWIDFAGDALIGFRRAGLMVVANTADEPVVTDAGGTILFDSFGRLDGCSSIVAPRVDGLLLEPAQAVVVRT